MLLFSSPASLFFTYHFPFPATAVPFSELRYPTGRGRCVVKPSTESSSGSASGVLSSKKKRSPRLASGALPLPMARVRRTRVSAPRGTAAATGASAGAAVDNTFTVPAVPQSSKLSALSDFLLPELVALRLCAQRADSAARVAGLRGAARTPDCSSA